MSALFGTSPFISKRKAFSDLVLTAFALLLPRSFTLFSVIAFPRYVKLAGGRRKIIGNLFSGFNAPSPAFQKKKISVVSLPEIWLIAGEMHAREKTMSKVFAGKISRTLSLSEKHQEQVENFPRDWVAVWLLILGNASHKRAFVLSGLSDFWFTPLKRHPQIYSMAFDTYDPMGEYRKGLTIKILNYINYHFGKFYIVRDARFKKAIRNAGNRAAKTCYLPDAPHFEVLSKEAVKNKFTGLDKIVFVSAGWVTAEGDGGMLRSSKLIHSLWPNAEIHLCLTKFMPVADERFAPLVEYLQKSGRGFVHSNLQGADYVAMLDKAHVGLNVHDPNVFGEEYEGELSKNMIRRSPSARVLDFAARGLILMTTNEHKYSSHVFSLYSPHKKLIHLANGMKPEELNRIIADIGGGKC